MNFRQAHTKIALIISREMGRILFIGNLTMEIGIFSKDLGVFTLICLLMENSRVQEILKIQLLLVYWNTQWWPSPIMDSKIYRLYGTENNGQIFLSLNCCWV